MSRSDIVNKTVKDPPKQEVHIRCDVVPSGGEIGQWLVRKEEGSALWADVPPIKPTSSICNDLLNDEQFEDNFNDLIYDALIDADVSCDYGYNSIEIPKARLKSLFKEVVSDVIERVGTLPKTSQPTNLNVLADSKTNEVKLNQNGESKMTNQVKRRVVNIQLLDNDQGLNVENSLVGEWNGVVTEDSNEITVQEIISTGEVATLLEGHNEVRQGQIDLDILKRTGNEVYLRPVKLKNLTWEIS